MEGHIAGILSRSALPAEGVTCRVRRSLLHGPGSEVWVALTAAGRSPQMEFCARCGCGGGRSVGKVNGLLPRSLNPLGYAMSRHDLVLPRCTGSLCSFGYTVLQVGNLLPNMTSDMAMLSPLSYLKQNPVTF